LKRDDLNATTYTVDFSDVGIIADQLRAAILADGRNANQLESATGVSRAAIGRLLKGERDVSLDTAEKLFQVLGVKIASQLPKKRSTPKK